MTAAAPERAARAGRPSWLVVADREIRDLWLGGRALILLFAYAVSWVMTYVGLLVPTPEVVNNASFMVIFPLTFLANTFVPSQNLPTVLRTFADWNPVSAITQAARELFGNVDPAAAAGGAWSLEHPVVYGLIWVGIILAVFVPLSVRKYQQAANK